MVKEDCFDSFDKLIYPLPALLVTCIDKKGKPNIIAIAGCMLVSNNPAVVAISVRPERYSYKLIRETREFVINVSSEKLVGPTDFCGTVSGRTVDKFEETKLTAVSARKVRSPIIEECLGHLECRMIKEIPMGDHSIFLGKVVTAYANKKYFDTNGWILNKTRILLSAGMKVYTTSNNYVTVETS